MLRVRCYRRLQPKRQPAKGVIVAAFADFRVDLATLRTRYSCHAENKTPLSRWEHDTSVILIARYFCHAEINMLLSRWEQYTSVTLIAGYFCYAENKILLSRWEQDTYNKFQFIFPGRLILTTVHCSPANGSSPVLRVAWTTWGWGNQ